jgi:hypothetical protein
VFVLHRPVMLIQYRLFSAEGDYYLTCFLSNMNTLMLKPCHGCFLGGLMTPGEAASAATDWGEGKGS